MSALSSTVRGPGRCEIVLFHSVLGLRPAVRRWAGRLRLEGHTVHLPDLYDGAVFDDFAAGLRHMDSISGIPAVIAASKAAVASLPSSLVYAGFSNGAAAAEPLAATRPGARGAILMHGALPLDAFGVTAWPPTVPTQLHYMTGDPFRTDANIDAFADAVRRSGARLDRYDYPGSGHLFADEDLADYDARAAELMYQRVREGLERMATGTPGNPGNASA